MSLNLDYWSTTRADSLASGMSNSDTTVVLADGSTFPEPVGGVPYTVIIGFGTSREEICTVTGKPSLSTLTVIRGEDGTPATAKNPGDTVVHGVSAREFRNMVDKLDRSGGTISGNLVVNGDLTTGGDLSAGSADVTGALSAGSIDTAGPLSSGALTATSIKVGATDVALSSDVAAIEARSVTAGNGLTGGGTLAATRTLNVGAGTGITVAADTVAVDTNTIATRAYADGKVLNSVGSSTTAASSQAAIKDYVDARIWTGTQAAYDAIGTKDPTVLYCITG